MDTILEEITTAENWVALAVGKPDEKRTFLRYLHAVDGIMYGTNAMRMHYAETQFPDGIYDPVSFMPVREAAPFPAPDWEKYTPVFETFQWTPADAIEEAALGPTGEATLRLSPEVVVNKTWLLEAMNGKLDGGVFFHPEDRRVAGMSNFGYFMLAIIVSK